MRALEVVSGNEMYADKQQICQSHKLGNPCPTARSPRPNKGHGTIPIMRLVIRTGCVGATWCSDWGGCESGNWL